MMMMLLLFCVGLLFVQLYSSDRESDLVDRTTFLGWMSDSTVKITELKVRRAQFDIVVQGRRALSPEEIAERAERPSGLFRAASEQRTDRGFTAYLLQADNQMLLEWERNKAPLKIEVVHEDATWVDRIFAFLPVLLVVGFFWFMMVRQQGGASGKGIFSFGKSKARVVDGKTKTTFADVAGCDEAKEDGRKVIVFS